MENKQESGSANERGVSVSPIDLVVKNTWFFKYQQANAAFHEMQLFRLRNHGKQHVGKESRFKSAVVELYANVAPALEKTEKFKDLYKTLPLFLMYPEKITIEEYEQTLFALSEALLFLGVTKIEEKQKTMAYGMQR